MKIFTRWQNEGAPRPLEASGSRPSETKQQFAKEADINFLIDRYNKTGAFYNPVSMVGKQPRIPQYVDLTSVGDLASQLATIADCRTLFAQLPSKVREMFGHDVASFVKFAQDPANFDRCVELGIFDRVNGVPAKAEELAAEGGDPKPAAGGVEQSAQPTT